MDLAGLLREYRSHWYWFVISLFVCGVIGLVIVKRHKERYVVTTSMLIEQDDQSGKGDGLSFDMSSMFGGGSQVDDELFLVSSHALYKNVARELKLDRARFLKEGLLNTTRVYEDYPVDVVTPALYPDTTRYPVSIKVNINSKGKAHVKIKNIREKEVIRDIENATLPLEVKTKLGTFTIVPTETFNPQDPEVTMFFVARNYDAAAEELSEDISAGLPSKNSNVIKLDYETPDPAFGRKLLDTILRHYNEQGVNRKNQKSQRTINFLDERIALLLDQIRQRDKQVKDFKENAGIVDVSSEASFNLRLKSQVANTLFQAETQLEIMKMAREFLNTPGNEYALVPFQNVSTSDNPQASEGLNELVSVYNNKVLQRMQIAANAKPDNIALRKISDQLDALRENIIVTMNKVAEGAEVAVRELYRQRDLAQKGIGEFPEQEREFINIYRDRNLLNSLYTYLLQKREETAIVLANAEPKGRIIDEAYQLKDPVSMSNKMILAIALLFGLFIPIVVLYLAKIFRTRIASAQEIENYTEVPVIGDLGITRADNPLVVTPGSTVPSAEAFKLVRSNLQFILSRPGQKTVLVTSSRSGEGKSFVSVNVGAALALLGKKVVVVGMDIRKPRLAKYLDLSEHTGVTAYLSNPGLKVSDIVMHNPLGVDNLDVIEAGVMPPNPSELLLTPRVDELFRQLRDEYDYIIIDAAALGQVGDTYSLARVSDATIYVVRLDVTQRSDLTTLNNAYEEKRLPNLGIVVNGGTHFRCFGKKNKEQFED